VLALYVFYYTGHTQKNGAVSKVNKKFMSHITRTQHTSSAAATVQVSHALPAARFSCLLHRNVPVLLNRVFPQRWIGRAAANGDKNLLPWPPRSPDLTSCDFFLWGFVKDSVYIPPLPKTIHKIRDRITHALLAITEDMLHRVWDEFDYRVDVCRVTQGAHIEGL
jgi:hypothetical protein